MKHFRSKGSANELAVGLFRDRFEHLSNSSTILGIEVGVDFIKEVKWCGITRLDGENESQGAKT